MTRAFVQLAETVSIDPPEGGIVRSSSANVRAPSVMPITPSGPGFGPLYVGVPSGSVCTLSEVSFLPGSDDDGGLPLIGLGVAAAPAPGPDDSEPSASRRGVLALVASILAAGVGSAATDSDLVALNIAELEVKQTDGPIAIRVLDIVSDVLPTSTEILVDAASTRVGQIADPEEGVIIPKSTSGTVKIYLRDSESRLSKLLAWARGLVASDDEVEFTRTLSQPAADFTEGTFVKLSGHPALVEPVKATNPARSRLTIGSTDIPHSDEDATSEAGAYGVFDGSLVYEVGPNPPNSDEWALRTRLGLLAEVEHKL